MRKVGRWGMGLLLGCVGVAACAAGNVGERISAKALLAQLGTPQAPLVVDVRQPEELTGPLGQLPGVVNLPMSELEARYTEIPKDRPVVLICRSGHRSSLALQFFKDKGYTRVKDVDGGMNAVRALQPQ